MKVRIIGNMDNTIDHTFESANRVYDKNGLCPTITTMQGGGREPMIIEDAKTTRGTDVVSTIRASYYKTGERNIRENIVSRKGYEGVIEETKCVAMRGRGENNEQQLEPNTQGVDNALTTVQKDNLVMETPRYRIRKLTPREVFRLMGYTDEDFDKAAAVNSNTQLYKEAGNAIVKQVLMAIFRQLKLKTKGENQCSMKK